MSVVIYLSPGPKFYGAYEDLFRVLSTRLHGDAADAFNIMTYCDKRDGAVWLGFSRQDTKKVAKILAKKLGIIGNPIHQQKMNIQAQELAWLAEEGVKPIEITQRLFDMVVIPVGCGHQVS